MPDVRIETDSLGAVEIEAGKLWGAQTQRALQHFSIGRDLMPREMIAAYAIVKRAAAGANHAQGRLSDEVHRLIVQACDEILAGAHQDMFPLNVWMSGSGTPFNMNVNEVIANRCAELAGQPLGGKKPAHPNDDVNMAQSTNDTFPTAMHVAAALGVARRLLPAVTALRDAIAAKAEAWETIVKIGRTHLQDATPLTLGQEFSGYAAMLTENLERIAAALSGLYPLALGGTAVGTGLNAPPRFAERFAARLAALTELPFVGALNKFEALAAHDAEVFVHGTLAAMAAGLFKIANDVRLLGSGPRCGLGELILPENEPGSAIMPGKVNPTQSEALTMVCCQVFGNQTIVTTAASQGHLELNVYKPVIAHALLQSIGLLADAASSFAEHCIAGIRPDMARIAELVEKSLMLVTALAPRIGYDKAAAIAKAAHANGTTLRQEAVRLGYVTAEEFDGLVRPDAMAHPS
jgi:fumarate hydratase, class II